MTTLTVSIPTNNLKTHAAVSVTSASVKLVLAANPLRLAALIQPLTTDIYIGDSTVTAATGIKITASDTRILSDEVSTGPIYAITSSGTADVRVAEVQKTI